MNIDSKDSNLATFCNVGGLCKEDQEILTQIGPQILPMIPALTDSFYAVLQSDPQTAPYVEGRIDQLKKTHIAWMNELFSGNYGPEFIQRQERIGDVHVKVRVPPLFVAASMSFLRAALPNIVVKHIADPDMAGKAETSLLRLLDLCQYLIDRKYNATLMDNLGISPALLTRLQTIARSS